MVLQGVTVWATWETDGRTKETDEETDGSICSQSHQVLQLQLSPWGERCLGCPYGGRQGTDNGLI